MKETNQKENVRGEKYNRSSHTNKARYRKGTGRACTGKEKEKCCRLNLKQK